MDRLITGFRQDDEGVWIADLECGHSQHVRHDPPWQVRPWVVEEATRMARVGTPLFCGVCPPDAAKVVYEDAKMCGLCEEGAEEAARPPERNDRRDR